MTKLRDGEMVLFIGLKAKCVSTVFGFPAKLYREILGETAERVRSERALDTRPRVGSAAPTTPRSNGLHALDHPSLPQGQLIYAIGDIHGRADLLALLLAKIAADAARGKDAERRTLVFLGDYIDRGP